MPEDTQKSVLRGIEYATVTLYHDFDSDGQLNEMAAEGWRIFQIIDRDKWQNFSRVVMSREL